MGLDGKREWIGFALISPHFLNFESLVWFEHYMTESVLEVLYIAYFCIIDQDIFIMIGAGVQLNKTSKQFQ